MKIPLSVILFITLLPIVALAQNPPDVCVVRSSWRSSKQKESGSIFVLGEFRPTAFDELTTKSFSYAETNLIVSASVEYGGRYSSEQKGKPDSIMLAISVSDKAQDAFDSTDNAVAGTKYGKKWGGLYVEKQVTDGEMTYTFVVHCFNDGKRKKTSVK